MKRSEKGFSIVEVALVIVVLGIIGFVGFRVWQANSTPQVSDTTGTSASQTQVPAINKTADLSTASASLDSTDVGDGDLTNLNNQLSF